jgi:hypothetical protein
VTKKGILSGPSVKPGKVLPPATAEIVKQFYVPDETNMIMQGTKDYVSVTVTQKARRFIRFIFTNN